MIGTMKRPACSGLLPSTYCSSCASVSSTPARAPLATTAMAMPARIAGRENSDRSSIGAAERSCRRANTASRAAPAASADAATAGGCPPPKPDLSPYTAAIMPAISSSACPAGHRPAAVRSGRGSSRNTAGNTTSITGTLMRNAAPHQKCSRSAPPTSGPTAAPAAPTVPQRPSAIARSRSSSNVRRMMPSTHGMIIEPPSASSTRAAISSAGLGANAASRDARPKTARPASSSRRWPVRSASVPMGTSRPAMSSG